MKPSFIVVEDGNYGGGNSSMLIFCAKKQGIKTIELQHGVFGISFDYGEMLLKNELFALQKTDLLFTFGNYWSEKVNFPGKCYAIGSIYLEEILMNTACYNDWKYILFASQGNHTIRLLEIAIDLSDMIDDDYKIIYKLHPKEYINLVQYKLQYRNHKKIEFIADADTYQLLKHASHVIGSFSTLLFECLYYGKTPFVFKDIFSDYYIPEDVGVRFSTSVELKFLIDENRQMKTDYDRYWAKDWKNRLMNVGVKENLW